MPRTYLLRYDPPPRTPVIDGEVYDPYKRSHEFGDSDSQAKLHEQLLTMSCAYYASHIIIGPPQHPYRGKFLLGKHHEVWDGAIREHRRILTRAQRDGGKSFFWCCAFPIWKADKNHPGCEIYIFSASQTLAEDRLATAVGQIEKNEKLQYLIPVGRDRTWSKREIKTTNGTLIRARGWGTRIRGGHPEYIVCDDPLDDHSLYSETVRNRATDFYFSAIVNMAHPDQQVVICSTPMHFADLYGKIEETKMYFVCDFPALDESGEPLFPERYDKAALEAKRQEVGPTRFAREFMCRPLTDEASLFPSHLFTGNDVRVPYRLGMPAAYWEEKGMMRYAGVDIAMSAEIGSDYFVIFTAAVDEQGRRWIVDIVRERGWGFQRQKDAIKECYAKYLPEVIHIESNQMQRVWPETLAEETGMNLRMFFTSGTAGSQPPKFWKKGMTTISVNKHHIDRGVPSLRVSLENRKWRIPRGDAHAIEMTDYWIGELQCISLQDGKVVSVGEHDDLVYGTWMADTAIRISGGLAAYWAGSDIAEGAVQPLMGVPQAGMDQLGPSLADLEEDDGFDPFGLKDQGGTNPLAMKPGIIGPSDNF